MRFIAPIAALIAGLLVVACDDSEPRVFITASEADFVPVIESSDVHAGMPRLVLTLLEGDAQPVFGDDATLVIRYFEPTEGGIKFHSDAQIGALDVEGFRYYIADAPPFNVGGQWAIAVTVEFPDGRSESSPRLGFIVDETPRGLIAGDAAPTVPTPTASDGALERMTAPPEASLSMYEYSAHEVLAEGRPFLIVWTSADRCAGRRACAQALEQARATHAEGEIDVIHVEPFGRPRSGALQERIDAAVEAWAIEAEPQFFVVDHDGVIKARFEIVVDDVELRSAVEAVLR